MVCPPSLAPVDRRAAIAPLGGAGRWCPGQRRPRAGTSYGLELGATPGGIVSGYASEDAACMQADLRE